MVKMRIAQDDKSIYFWSYEQVKDINYTRFCVEDISWPLYDALMLAGSMPEHQETVSNILYEVLSKKGLSTN